MSKCLKCGKTFYELAELFTLKESYICEECSLNYQPILKETTFEGMKVTYLYEYQDELMSDLLTLKSRGQKEMRDVLISLKIRKKLQKKYHDCVFLYMPSSKEDDEERGFRHVEELFHDIAKETSYPLMKTQKYKQATSKLSQRKQVKKYLAKDQNFKLEPKKYVLVDDIISSGSTLKAAKEILGLETCEILVLLWNHQDF